MRILRRLGPTANHEVQEMETSDTVNVSDGGRDRGGYRRQGERGYSTFRQGTENDAVV